MVQEIITYPRPLSLEYGTDVRIYDAKLFALLEDLKDTIKANNLQALSAYQIGSYFNVIVFRNEAGEFIEMVNPVQISHSGESIEEETTFYYGNRSAKVKRFTDISVIYEDRKGKNHSLKLSNDAARIIQRKLDYLFGSTFLDRLSKDEKEKFEAKLSLGADVGKENYCPTTFVRDKIIKAINLLLLAMVLLFFVSFMVDASLWQYQLYSSFIVLFLQIVYFFYAQYEGKKYSSCVSCSIGNIIGTTFISFIRLSLVMIPSYFFM